MRCVRVNAGASDQVGLCRHRCSFSRTALQEMLFPPRLRHCTLLFMVMGIVVSFHAAPVAGQWAWRLQTWSCPKKALSGVAPFTYALRPILPEGLTFDTTSRTISGTPAVVADAPTFTCRTTASNGSADSLMFSMVINAPVDAQRGVFA